MKNYLSIFLKSSVALFAAVFLFGSCMNEDLWDKVNQLENRLDSLENNLNNQVEALNALLSNGSTIKSCVKNDDGSYLITLSNGTKFTAMSGNANLANLVSYVVIDGKKCWATYDPSGELVALEDNSGNPIPVQSSIQVKIKDGVYYLVVDGTEYVTGYESKDVVQVFSSCTPLTDASGNVYAVTFTLGEGLEITVTVDGYKGALFKLSSINRAILTEYYIDFGQSQTFLMETAGVIDYVMQIPDGWRVSEKVDKLSGELYVTITAPSESTIAMNAAVASGDLKVVSVVEGGKAAVTKLTLSTDPFKTYEVSALRAVVDPYEGVDKFVYGVTASAKYDKATLISQIAEHYKTSADLPAGCYESEVAIDKLYEEIYPEISEDDAYYFWVIPVLYRDGDGDDAGYYVVEEMFREYNLTPMSVTMDVTSPMLLDADLSLKVVGAKYMYAGVSVKQENTLTEIVSQVNNGVYDPYSDAALFRYNGPVSSFPDAEVPYLLDPASTYLVWVIPVQQDKESFTVSDIIYKEFTTKSVTAGGTIEVAVNEASVDMTSITDYVTSDDAAMIYYAFLDNTTGGRYAKDGITNETRWKYLTEASTFNVVRGASAEAVIEDLLPGTTMWLYTAAVGNDGLYGTVKCVSSKTQSVTFNNLKVSLEKVEILADEATLKVNVEGGVATDYVYWVGRKTDPFWVEQCGGMKDNASKFMAAKPDYEAIVQVMKANGPVGEDGLLKLHDLAIAKEHVALVAAKDESGNYSKCGYVTFETSSINLGADYAPEGSQKWNETRQWIEDNIVWDKDYFRAAAGSGQGFASYAFDIKTPTNCTAYISCFTTVAAINGGMKMDIMVELEESCSSKTSVGGYVVDPETGEEPRHPDWYDDNGRFIQGSQVNLYTSYSHGNPNNGMVTYFAEGAHDDAHCTSWRNGECSNYAEQMATIAKLTSLDYWREYIIDFGNYAYMGDPNHAYSRTLKDPEKIEAIANQYYELYCKYYEGVTPLIYINDGSPLRITNREATGLDDQGNVLDVVTVMLKDVDGNYYDPMYFPVPNYFVSE